MTASRYQGASPSRYGGVSPSRYGTASELPRASHSSPIRPRQEVTRDLLQKSTIRDEFSSPSRLGSSSYG